MKAAGGTALGAGLLGKAPHARAKDPDPSPATNPWQVALPIQTPKSPVSSLSPLPAPYPVSGECGRNEHQAWSHYPPVAFYEVRVREGSHSFHPQLPTQKVRGYDGTFPGPLFHARYGSPFLVRFRNDLSPTMTGPGSPQISVHVHNLHQPSESDGFPGDYFGPTLAGPTLTAPGDFKDHHYPMCCAGITATNEYGDFREANGTMWYHDHRLDFTGANVYGGMAGFFLAFDDIDSGNENDTNPQALRLPSGAYDVPMMITDHRFTRRGQLFFDQFETDGLLGDKFAVNGKIQPFFRVARRKYRFRFLDASVSRFYDLVIRRGTTDQAFQYIANDGNLLAAPLTRTSVRIAPAERADIVIDFSQYPIGTELFLVNRLEQTDGRGPTGRLLNPGTQIMKIIVDRNASSPDNSRVPAALRTQPLITLSEVVRTREFRFDRENEVWTVNSRIFDVDVPAATMRMGTAEIWSLRNSSSGWSHPVHIHFEEGRILTRNGVAPPAHEAGRKDVYVLGPNETVRIFLRFRDYPGKYVMHCHNLTHEDHAMMARWDIVP